MPEYHKHTRALLEHALRHMEAGIYTPLADLQATAWITPEPVPFSQRQSGDPRAIAVGQSWGKLWDCAWFRFQGHVPPEAQGQTVVLLIDLSGEGCVFDEAGCPVLGLTTQSSTFDFSLGRPGKTVAPLADVARGGEPIDLWVEAGNNDLFGSYQDNGTLKAACVATINPTLFDLYHDFYLLNDLLKEIPEDRARHHSILAALLTATQAAAPGTTEALQAAREVLAPELAKQGGSPSLSISAIGHAHIDLAWLWPLRETIRKGGRTFATALHNLDHYPDYVFGASQPQLYQWMKDHYPALYAKVKTKIAEGRWEPQGAMWVEPDTNIPSGESLIRQILYGKRFFREEFDFEPRILWLPDVFGYSGSLPQILKRSGVDYFMTQKLSWNTFNTFPHHTFWWQGIDGSQVLAHMPPEGTYNSAAEPHSLLTAERSFRDKGVSDQCLLLFGIGDGGGGPGTSHLEALKREHNLDGLPPVVQEPAETFFAKLAQGGEAYQRWSGELYLERHQGTYTTQARSKRFNRKLELALRELELWAAVTNAALPRAEVDAIWQEMLLYQFHDILPGSSITRVYDESLARYAELLQQVEQLTAQIQTQFAQSLTTGNLERPALILNSLGWERTEWLRVDENWLQVTIPPIGYTVVESAAPPGDLPPLVAEPDRLENDVLRVQFGDDGATVSVYDKAQGREVLSGPGNILAIYQDYGDAWDILYDYREQAPMRFVLTACEAVVDGPQAVLRQTYQFNQSTLMQEIILVAGRRRLDFVTHVDWQEDHKMLRTSFPLTVRTAEATCDIQMGTIRRPTHRNTSWDVARHEICAHKWVDLSQPDYGVALMNDCKYGYYVEESLLDLNLLRSPDRPDPQADRAHHEFTYSLYPHAGDHIAGQVVQEAYALNVPLKCMTITGHSGATAAEKALISVDSPAIVIETIKPAEDGKGLIVRLFETHGTNAAGHLICAAPFSAVWETDLMETAIAQFETAEDRIPLLFAPFEIKTLRIQP